MTNRSEVRPEVGPEARPEARFDATVPTPAPAAEAHIRELIRAAAEWRLVALLFERPREGWHEQLARLAAEVPDPALREAVRAADGFDEALYLHLLGPGGQVSPREVAYRGRHDPGEILADIAAFQEAFAFHPVSEDPPDHAGRLAALAGYLQLKEAYALHAGNSEAADVARDALARLIDSHLRWMGTPLAERLAPWGPTHLALAAGWLAGKVGEPPEKLPLDIDPEDAMACGLGGCPLAEAGEDVDNILG